MIELGRLYDLRSPAGPHGFFTVQALSQDHGHGVHCRVYMPGNETWHGWAIVCAENELRKIDRPPPADGWETVLYAPKESPCSPEPSAALP